MSLLYLPTAQRLLLCVSALLLEVKGWSRPVNIAGLTKYVNKTFTLCNCLCHGSMADTLLVVQTGRPNLLQPAVAHCLLMHACYNTHRLTLHPLCMTQVLQDTLHRTTSKYTQQQLQCKPAVVAEEHAPSLMLRQAMWVPTKEDEQAVSTASTPKVSVTDLIKSDLFWGAAEICTSKQGMIWMWMWMCRTPRGDTRHSDITGASATGVIFDRCMMLIRCTMLSIDSQ